MAAPHGEDPSPEFAHTLGDGSEDYLLEEGRRLASQREDLIAAGADPAELEIPLAPRAGAGSPCSAPGCPAMRYAPLDEHLIAAHHTYDNRKART